MDPISQGTLGAALPLGAMSPKKARAIAMLGCAAGLAPDLDVLLASRTDPLLFLEFHRQFTHALAFIPVGAGIVALLLHPLVRRRLRLAETYLACLLGYATHGLLDACTSYGTQLFWPFSDTRVAWNNVSVLDPMFTAPLLGLAAAAAVWRKPTLARVGLGWAAVYLVLGAVQHQRAVWAGEALATSRGHVAARLTAKPGFANLLVWKTVYLHDGTYHIDAVRAGVGVTICPGPSVPALDVGRHLPWLPAHSQQARDIERFRWFSDGYVAPDPTRPNRVIDIRYSVVANSAAPLWGIELDPAAGPLAHAGFVGDRRLNARQARAFRALLRGDSCAPLRQVERHADLRSRQALDEQ